MCTRAKIENEIDRIMARFLKRLRGKQQMKLFDFEGSPEFNGYDQPFMPVVTNEVPDEVQLFRWGLIPRFAKELKYGLQCLNARRETINIKPSFRNIVQNRCIVIVDGIYEWQAVDNMGMPDPNGKKRRKFYIYQTDEQPMAIAGLWAYHKEYGPTFTMLTKPAVGLMAEIHNAKLRMPVILDPSQEDDWMEGKEIEDIVPDLECYVV